MIGLLLSGGMDSTALAYMHRPDVAFNVDYGQIPAMAERRASKAICESLGINLVEISVDCSGLGSGDLSDRGAIEVAPETDWWPYRNQLLITLCAMKAVELGVSSILIGTVRSDSFHADGSPRFVEDMDRLLRRQEGGISVSAPAIALSTVELIRQSRIPLELLAGCHSCHKADIPCAECRGCNKYFSTMIELEW